ncbi:thiosulfate sulfurtransferase (rhodanese)-like domain-containing protein 2 [Rhizophlyctis rosea]|uniref:Thiosulfate sulfurtransferase (Rhodanese)-like domain-containing protein 2 n=1 Tax=Rhizophlyctis rosea TaxID=64517 RepID=A0AAD5S3L9_9FUNG|nr:thiosulfate sulfurtransferase (rhodanese)-like domain-containing protein 2 [Rhizophlyctis rosea]
MLFPMPTKEDKVLRRRAITDLLKRLKTGCDRWLCCNEDFFSLETAHRHITSTHSSEITSLIHSFNNPPTPPQTDSSLSSRRALPGSSDSIKLNCSCQPGTGQVLLFYRYKNIDDPRSVAVWQQELAKRLGLSGKIRVAGEGVNVTVAGEVKAVEEYMDEFGEHEVLSGLGLEKGGEDEGWKKRRKDFFKPSPGCVHGEKRRALSQK